MFTKEHYSIKKKGRYDEIADTIIDMVGFNIFENTRKREFSDARALLVKLLVDEYKLGWTEIQNFFTNRGKPIKSHASIIHLYNIFPDAVLRNNIKIKAVYNHILSSYQSETATENVIERIRNIDHPEKFSVIEECLNTLDI